MLFISIVLKKHFLFKQKKKHRSRQKKLKPFDLSSLAEFLPELKSSQKPTAAADFKLNWKSRQKLMFVLQFMLFNVVIQFYFSIFMNLINVYSIQIEGRETVEYSSQPSCFPGGSTSRHSSPLAEHTTCFR